MPALYAVSFLGCKKGNAPFGPFFHGYLLAAMGAWVRDARLTEGVGLLEVQVGVDDAVPVLVDP